MNVRGKASLIHAVMFRRSRHVGIWMIGFVDLHISLMWDLCMSSDSFGLIDATLLSLHRVAFGPQEYPLDVLIHTGTFIFEEAHFILHGSRVKRRISGIVAQVQKAVITHRRQQLGSEIDTDNLKKKAIGVSSNNVDLAALKLFSIMLKLNVLKTIHSELR